jgi:hypothetical protein
VYLATIAGSGPVTIHDDQFRFDFNLVTGKTVGQVFLFNHIAGPKVRCTPEGIGTGLNADGNPTFTHSGECTLRGQSRELVRELMRNGVAPRHRKNTVHDCGSITCLRRRRYDRGDGGFARAIPGRVA